MRVRRRPRLLWLAISGLSVLVIGAVFLVLWRAPTSDFLFEPGNTRDVDALVSVEGEKPDAGEAAGDGIFMVDISVRHATLLERLLPFLRKDGTIVPEDALNPEGLTDEQRGVVDRRAMSQSQRIAAAVALRALGYDVRITRSGADVNLVIPGSPAEAGGLRTGDTITAVDGTAIRSPQELRGILAGVEPGDSVELTVRRGDEDVRLTVGTKADEASPGRAVMGVEIEPAATIELPLDVTVDAKGIGGPSAGLAFALGIVDELGTEVDRGRKVVVTGQLTFDGSVLPIGGIKQKTIAARRGGADVFVVPIDNAAEAQRYADGLRIVPVQSFDEALDGLGVSLPRRAAA